MISILFFKNRDIFNCVNITKIKIFRITTKSSAKWLKIWKMKINTFKNILLIFILSKFCNIKVYDLIILSICKLVANAIWFILLYPILLSLIPKISFNEKGSDLIFPFIFLMMEPILSIIGSYAAYILIFFVEKFFLNLYFFLRVKKNIKIIKLQTGI